MFTLSAKGIYGINALFELALNYNQKHIQIKQIAEAQAIPQHYLEQLLVVLKKGGFVKSYRGNQGGYALAKNPHQINILEVMECLEGSLCLIQPENKSSTLNFFWDTLEKNIKSQLNLSLHSLIQLRQHNQNQLNYNI